MCDWLLVFSSKNKPDIFQLGLFLVYMDVKMLYNSCLHSDANRCVTTYLYQPYSI